MSEVKKETPKELPALVCSKCGHGASRVVEVKPGKFKKVGGATLWKVNEKYICSDCLPDNQKRITRRERRGNVKVGVKG